MSAIHQLAAIKSAKGKLKVEGNLASGALTLDTEHGDLELTLAEFDAIYAGFVRCWPTIRPLKEQVNAKQRELAEEERKAKKAEREAAREEEKAKAKEAREAAAAKRKADKEAKAKAANAKMKADLAAKKAKKKAKKNGKAKRAGAPPAPETKDVQTA